MKKRFALFIAVLSVILVGCKSDGPEEDSILTVAQTTITDVSSEATQLSVALTCNNKWDASSSETWCTVSPESGSSNNTLTITLGKNELGTSRTAIVTITSQKQQKKISITQNGIDISTYLYNLNVIFHVIYKDKSNKEQYISSNRFASIIDNVNKLYRNSGSFDKINLNFVLATEDDKGNKLSTPGIEYLQWDSTYPINYDTFMGDETGKYVSMLWDPNKYINVMVYIFSNESDGESVLGISYMPYTVKGTNSLEGLSETQYSTLTLNNLKYAHCISINGTYISEEDESTDDTYSPFDVNVTLAHELGHYLGLHHVFSESETSSCEDTDYCNDTESYNRKEYEADLSYLFQNNQDGIKYSDIVKRTNCSNKTFVSHNYMDYSYSYSDQFTEDQAARIRNVLMYSPLIPGPKATVSSTASRSASGKIDLPRIVVK